MKPARTFLIFLLFSGTLFVSCTSALHARRHIDTKKLARQIDGVMVPLVKDNLLSGAVLIAINDAIVFQKAYGLADIENRLPNREDTKFALASVTKMFTALAIMQLHERGKLDLQDKLIKYLPDFPSGDKITVYNLLTHTSGLPTFTAVGKNHADFKEVIDWIKAMPSKFKPGEDFEYSNSGYALLAFIIEKVSGQTYEDYLKQNIFIPCEMKNSGMLPYDIAVDVGNLANGYSITESGRLQLSERRGALGKGEGSLYSTTADMYRFSKALFNHALLSQKYLELMFKPFKQAYGIGCMVENHQGWKVVYHPGGTNGARTNFKTFTKSKNKVTVVNLFNTDFMLSGLVDKQIEKIALGEPWKPIFHLKKSLINSFKNFAGTYEIAADDIFRITVENNQIFFQSNGQKKYTAFPYSDTSIYIKELNSRYRFTEDRKSKEVTFVGFIGTPITAFMVEGNRIKNN